MLYYCIGHFIKGILITERLALFSFRQINSAANMKSHALVGTKSTFYCTQLNRFYNAKVHLHLTIRKAQISRN